MPDPTRALESYKLAKGVVERDSFVLPELEAFQVILEKWISLVESPVAIDIMTFVNRNVYSLTIDQELKAKMSTWLAKKNYKLRMSYVETSDLRKIINLFYIAFCEYVGPVRADELLAKSLAQLKTNGGAVYSQLFNKML